MREKVKPKKIKKEENDESLEEAEKEIILPKKGAQKVSEIEEGEVDEQDEKVIDEVPIEDMEDLESDDVDIGDEDMDPFHDKWEE